MFDFIFSNIFNMLWVRIKSIKTKANNLNNPLNVLLLITNLICCNSYIRCSKKQGFGIRRKIYFITH